MKTFSQYLVEQDEETKVEKVGSAFLDFFYRTINKLEPKLNFKPDPIVSDVTTDYLEVYGSIFRGTLGASAIVGYSEDSEGDPWIDDIRTLIFNTDEAFDYFASSEVDFKFELNTNFQRVVEMVHKMMWEDLHREETQEKILNTLPPSEVAKIVPFMSPGFKDKYGHWTNLSDVGVI